MKKKKPVTTANEANKLHAAWMKLSSNSNDATKRAAMDAFERMPKAYVSVWKDGTRASVIHGCMPLTAAIPLDSAVAYARKMGVQTTLRWQADRWIDAQE